MQIIDTILSTLLSLWLWDVSVFSNPWMYWPLLVPVMFFSIFFILKWTLLTLPFWLPLSLIVSALRRRS
jgi:hypothetical protein